MKEDPHSNIRLTEIALRITIGAVLLIPFSQVSLSQCSTHASTVSGT